MGNTIVDNSYYDWLLDQVEYCPGDYIYDRLFELMFNTDFRWSVANDDNRAGDGVQLRYTFVDEEGWNTVPKEDEPCSVLEMLVALAMRIENDIMWDGEEDRTSKWFWEMINNLGFNKVHPDDFPLVIDRFLDRKYDSDGNGGLFPLKSVLFSDDVLNPDQKEVEIWYQAQLYLMKKYEF